MYLLIIKQTGAIVIRNEINHIMQYKHLKPFVYINITCISRDPFSCHKIAVMIRAYKQTTQNKQHHKGRWLRNI